MSQTCRETGWSMQIVVRACRENGVNYSQLGMGRKKGSFIIPRLKITQDEQFSEKIQEIESENLQQKIQILFPGNLCSPNPQRQHRKKYNVKYKPLPDGCRADQPTILPEDAEKIQLTRNLFAIVDRDMVELISRFNWSAAPDYRTAYAICRDPDSGKTCKMHRMILGIQTGKHVMIDHINGNGLDNRRCNLRIVTNAENQANRHSTPINKSRFKGVSLATGKWACLFKHDGTYQKKYFDVEFEAAAYYDSLVKKHRGPSAKTNQELGRYTPEELSKITELFDCPGTENHGTNPPKSNPT